MVDSGTREDGEEAVGGRIIVADRQPLVRGSQHVYPRLRWHSILMKNVGHPGGLIWLADLVWLMPGTTLLMRNVPNDLNQEGLVDLILKICKQRGKSTSLELI